MHLDKTKRNKLQPRSIPVIFVGYPTEAKAWLVVRPSRQRRVCMYVSYHSFASICCM